MRIRTTNIAEFVIMLPPTLMRLFYGDERRTRALGRPFFVSLRDVVVSRGILAQGVWEPDETAVVQHLCRLGDHVVDIGANIGYYSVIYGSQVGALGRVLALEPDPENLKLLRKNLQVNFLNDIVQIAAVAAGSETGEITLYLSPLNRGDHRTYEAFDLDMFSRKRPRKERSVRVIRVDDLVANWKRVDLIKMDIQGYEPRALEGMRHTLLRNEGVVLITEFWPHGLQLAGSSGKEYLECLLSFDFLIFEICARGSLQKVDVPELLGRLVQKQHVDLVCARPNLGTDRLKSLISFS